MVTRAMRTPSSGVGDREGGEDLSQPHFKVDVGLEEPRLGAHAQSHAKDLAGCRQAPLSHFKLRRKHPYLHAQYS